MFHRVLIVTACSALLSACSPDKGAPEAAARVEEKAPAQADAGSVRRERVRRDNVIEIALGAQTFRADTASSYSLSTLGDGRINLQFSSGWIGEGEMSIVELGVMNIGAEPATHALTDGSNDAVHMHIAKIPGMSTRSWRSLDGTVEVQAITRDEDNHFRHAKGRFEGRFGESDPGTGQVAADAPEIELSGTFTFTAD